MRELRAGVEADSGGKNRTGLIACIVSVLATFVNKMSAITNPTNPAPFNPTVVIKEIGRGKEGARSLSRDAARELMQHMLAGNIEPLPLGAILMAYRIKGETPEELAGFLDAIHAHMSLIMRPNLSGGSIENAALGEAFQPFSTVVIPSYNGARKAANLVPLLAHLLVREGVPVLVHGVSQDAKRVTTLDIFNAMGESICLSANAAADALTAKKLAVIAIESLSPPFAALLEKRWVMGVRNSSHSLAKMLQPVAGPALRLVSVTHPEYIVAMRTYFATFGGDALLMRGTEGETVANTMRLQAIESFREGRGVVVLEAEVQAGPVLDTLPAAIDATTTAAWIIDVLAGKVPVPRNIQKQVAVIVAAAKR